MIKHCLFFVNHFRDQNHNSSVEKKPETSFQAGEVKSFAKRFFLYFIRDFFFVSLALFLTLLISEDLKNGFVSNHMNLRLILTVVAVSGLISLFTSKIIRGPTSDDKNGLKF